MNIINQPHLSLTQAQLRILNLTNAGTGLTLAACSRKPVERLERLGLVKVERLTGSSFSYYLTAI